MGDKKGGGIALLCCFIALGVAAVIAFITYLLPACGVSVSSTVTDVLDLVFKIVTLIGLVLGAFAYARRHGKIIKILTAIFALIFVVAIILVIVNIV